MLDILSANRKNALLRSLSGDDFALLQQHLERIELPLRFPLEDRNRRTAHVYFPEAGLVSVVASGAKNREIEVGIIGSEGMSGIHVLLGSDRSSFSAYMQVAGNGYRIATVDLQAAMRASPAMQQCFLLFAQTFIIQTAHTAIANGQGTLEQRLARWLLMADDRIRGNELPLTHEFLAMMLAVRRAGVTTTLRSLEHRKLVLVKRRAITVLNRDGLKRLAKGLYGIPEAEYRRLIGRTVSGQTG